MIEKIVFEISGRSLHTFLGIHSGYADRRDHAETLNALIDHIHRFDPYLEPCDEPGIRVLKIDRTRFEEGQLVGFTNESSEIGYGRVVGQGIEADIVNLELTARTIEKFNFTTTEARIPVSKVFAL